MDAVRYKAPRLEVVGSLTELTLDKGSELDDEDAQ